MKSIIKYFSVTALITAAVHFPAHAQEGNHLLQFMEQYSDSPTYSFVSISADMLDLIKGREKGNTQNGKPATGRNTGHSDIKSLQLLSSERRATQLYTLARQLISQNKYQTVMTVKDDGEQIQFFTERGAGRFARQLLMLSRDKDECVLMLITGHIDMDNLEAINIPGMPGTLPGRKK